MSTQQTTPIAKITRPRISGALSRERLFSLLDADGGRLTSWISGPPGAGKTTLAASYIESRGFAKNTLWYQVDGGDSDLATFFHYMGLAAKKAAPRRKRPLPHFTPEYAFGVPVFTKRFFEELYSRLKPPFVIVFDNFQEVPDGSPTHDVIANAIGELPRGGKVLILSRTDPSSALARLRVNGEMDLIDYSELRLTPEEACDVAELKVGDIPSDVEEIEALYKKSGGWTGGLVLMLENAGKGGAGVRLPSGTTPVEIFDYFASELLERTDEERRDFLLKSSFLSAMNPVMAKKLTGNTSSGDILTKLCRKNFFTYRTLRQESTFQYHPLFREFLTEQAVARFTTEEITNIKRAAALISEEAGLTDDAASLMAEAEQWPELTGLVMKHAPKLMAEGRCIVLSRWIEAIDKSIREENPWLLYWLGVARMPYNPPGAYEGLERAFELFEAAGDPAGIFLSWSGAIDCLVYCFDNFSSIDPWIERIDPLLEKYPMPSVEVESFVAQSTLLAFIFRDPVRQGVHRWAERSYELSKLNPNPIFRLRAGGSLGFYNIVINGDLARAGVVIEELVPIMRDMDAPPLGVAQARVVECYYHWICGRSAEALEVAEEGLEFTRRAGVPVMDYLLLGHGACAVFAVGDVDKGSEFIKEMSGVINMQSNHLSSYYYLLSGWESMMRGDLIGALQKTEMALELAIKSGSKLGEYITRFVRARILYENGRCGEARELLEEGLAFARLIKSPLYEYEYYISLSCWELNEGRDKEGLAALGEALSIASRHGFVRYYYWQPEVMAALMKRALDEGIEVNYVKEIIRRCELVPADPPLDCEQWPWPVKIYTLGSFRIVRGDTPVRSGRKAQQKTLELLKILISSGGVDVNEDEVADILWPDSDGDAAKNSLTTAVYRLRKLLGSDRTVVRSEKRIGLDPRSCWVDIWAFERALDRAQSSSVEDGVRAGWIKEVLSLYQGHFLSGDTDSAWSINMRERLRTRFLRSTATLAAIYEESGDLESAIDCLTKGIEQDPLAEGLYRELMHCYKKLGRNSEVASLFGKLERNLVTTLMVEPSAETLALYKSVVETQG